MIPAYVDTSVLAAVMLPDEDEHDRYRLLIHESGHDLVTSELSAVELTGAAARAGRTGRLRDVATFVRAIDQLVGADAPVAEVALAPTRDFPLARSVLLRTEVRSADAIHLAVALQLQAQLETPLAFVTADQRQQRAAEALGFQPLPG